MKSGFAKTLVVAGGALASAWTGISPAQARNDAFGPAREWSFSPTAFGCIATIPDIDEPKKYDVLIVHTRAHNGYIAGDVQYIGDHAVHFPNMIFIHANGEITGGKFDQAKRGDLHRLGGDAFHTCLRAGPDG